MAYHNSEHELSLRRTIHMSDTTDKKELIGEIVKNLTPHLSSFRIQNKLLIPSKIEEYLSSALEGYEVVKKLKTK